MQNLPSQRAGIWWVNPSKYLLFFLLPIFLVACFFGPPLMPMFGMINYIDVGAIAIGALVPHDIQVRSCGFINDFCSPPGAETLSN